MRWLVWGGVCFMQSYLVSNYRRGTEENIAVTGIKNNVLVIREVIWYSGFISAMN